MLKKLQERGKEFEEMQNRALAQYNCQISLDQIKGLFPKECLLSLENDSRQIELDTFRPFWDESKGKAQTDIVVLSPDSPDFQFASEIFKSLWGDS